MSYRSRIAFRYLVAPVLCIIVYFTVIFLAAVTIASVEGKDYLDYEGKIFLLEGILGLCVVFGWILIKKRLVLKNPSCAIGKPIDWSFGVISALAMLGVAAIYFMVVTRVSVPIVEDSLKDYDELMEVHSASKADLYMNVIATCFLIPILEEIIFRGFVMEGMLELDHPILAILISSVYFGGMHGQPIQIGYAFLAGLILGAVYYLTRNIVMPILAHIIFNSLGSGLYMLFSVSKTTDDVLTVIEMVSILPFAGLCVYMALKRKQRFPGKEAETGDINKMLPGRHT